MMSKNEELQLKTTKIKEEHRTKRHEIADQIWSKRIIMTIIITTGIVLSIGLIVNR